MVIPVGPPGAQHIPEGAVKKSRRSRRRAFGRALGHFPGGKVIPFVPLSGGHQSEELMTRVPRVSAIRAPRRDVCRFTCCERALKERSYRWVKCSVCSSRWEF